VFHYKRSMTVDLFKDDDGAVNATAKLSIGSPSLPKRYVYQLSVAFEPRQGVLVVVDAVVDALSAEAEACDQTRLLACRMKGIALDEKYLWKIYNIFGRSDGCQHLYELALEIARAHSNLSVGEYLQIVQDADRPVPPVTLSLHCAGLAYLEGAKETL